MEYQQRCYFLVDPHNRMKLTQTVDLTHCYFYLLSLCFFKETVGFVKKHALLLALVEINDIGALHCWEI